MICTYNDGKSLFLFPSIVSYLIKGTWTDYGNLSYKAKFTFKNIKYNYTAKLPSVDELNKYTTENNRRTYGSGSSDIRYWTRSSFNSNYAFTWCIDDGSIERALINKVYRVAPCLLITNSN